MSMPFKWNLHVVYKLEIDLFHKNQPSVGKESQQTPSPHRFHLNQFASKRKALSAAKEAVEKSNDEQVRESLAVDLCGGWIFREYNRNMF